jgi:hypothetical protein
MATVRDHKPLVIENFDGWWNRGDPESAPSGHFIQADNIQYFHSGVETRDGLVGYITDPFPPLKVLRVYNYVTMKGHSLIVLTVGGKIWHIEDRNLLPANPILTIPAMEDFGFVAINGRAYITPFKTYTDSTGTKYSLGLKNEFLYVYKGDQSQARKAGGLPPMVADTNGQLGVQNDVGGLTDEGLHYLAVVYETDTGFMTAPGPLIQGTNVPAFGHLEFDGLHKILVSNIPLGPLEQPGGFPSRVRRRHIVSTKAILDFNGDPLGYQFFFVPGGMIDDNFIQSKVIEYFDIDLVSDASHLIDNFSEIPAGVNVNTYHSRLIIVGEFGLSGPPDTTENTLTGLPVGVTDNRSIARVSHPGEPEAFSKIDGLIIAPLDGNPLTNVQEFRDILYLFKKTRTFAYSDNNDVPASWHEEVLDQGIGAPVHGIATVLDTGGVNIDFLVIIDWSGLMLFNGTYAQPELTFKIEDFWRGLDRNEFHNMQIVNDSINKKIWISLPEPHRKEMLHANYQNGMAGNTVRWARWIFDIKAFTIALIETDRLVIGTPGPEF